MKHISKSINLKLEAVSRMFKTVPDIYTTEFISRVKDSEPDSIYIFDEKIYKGILAQIPEGIYVTFAELLKAIESRIKIAKEASTKYSIIANKHNELNACKILPYIIGNVITGRDKEISEILLTLCKKDKRGVILVGEPGTGKTAIVRAINSRLVEKTVPRTLIGTELYNMDVPYIFSKYKDDPIGTIIKILETASADDKCVLFIDEVHQLLNQKMNDIMKPYLTEKLRFIGSTTIDEYHSIVTDDRALERRFTIVHVNEPNITETIRMVQGTRTVFENFHKCNISADVCEYLVSNGSRFLGSRRNPDKSLDILDIACTILNNNEVQVVVPEETAKGKLAGIDLDNSRIHNIKTVSGNRTLTTDYVDKAISNITGIDYGTIRNSLEFSFVCKKLKEAVVGQDNAIDEFANVVNVIKNINYDQIRPLSTILFVGVAGIGKATTALELTKLIFGSKNNIVDYDLSPFKDQFMITELKGAPPGYVGYSKSGRLVKEIKNKPQSLIYFRNPHQCHESIQDYVFSAVKNGCFTDSSEREGKLNNSIVVFSVTITQDEYDNLGKKKSTMGFSTDKGSNDRVKNLNKLVRQELIDLADTIIFFDPLGSNHLETIFDMKIDQFIKMYRNCQINVDELKKEVVAESKNGHDVLSKLSSKIPKLLFKLTQEKS